MSKKIAFNFDYILILFSLTLIRLPLIFLNREDVIVHSLFMFPFAYSLSRNLYLIFNKKTFFFNNKYFFSFAAYIVLLIISFIRTAMADTFSFAGTWGLLITWCLIGSTIVLIFSSNLEVSKSKKYREAIYYGLLLFVALNIALNMFGYKNLKEENIYIANATMASLMGLNVTRDLFPMAIGVNSFGAIGGASLCVSGYLLLNKKGIKDLTIGLFGVLSSLYVVILTDSRGALVIALMLIVITTYSRKIYFKYLPWLLWILIILPPIILAFLRYISYGFLNQAGNASRSLITMSGRDRIWTAIINELLDVKYIHIFGYGYRGQTISNIAAIYGFQFYSAADPLSVSSHNFVLQTILETGYFGLLAAFVLIIFTSARLSYFSRKNLKDQTIFVHYLILLYMLLIGITETVLTPNHLELFLLFLFICASTGSLRTIKSLKNSV